MKNLAKLLRALSGFTVMMILCPMILSAQVITSSVQHIPLRKVIDISKNGDTWFPVLQHQRLPKPHPGIDRQQAERMKADLAAKYPLKEVEMPAQRMMANAPVIGRNFIGNAFNFFVPNDNDMAISNGDITCSVSNTVIHNKDLNANIVYGSYTLHSLCASLGLPAEEFDPKVVYDPQADRFVVLFLNGFTDSTNSIIVGFSQTNSSYGAWNFYSLPGDALNNGLWTDFPMVALNNHELFITGNLLYNDSSWQTGFNQSIIWQIKKSDGYQGLPLTSQVHSNIFYNGGPIRNICPVKGGSGTYGPNMYFLSNRNFSTGNDSIFMVEITDTIGAAGVAVTVQHLTVPMQYFMPVDVTQPATTEKLIVNDARMMAAYKEGNDLQFVFAALDTASGRDGVFHGRIDFSGPQPVVTADMLLHPTPTASIAYPNISYAGTAPGNQKSVINFLYGGPSNYPGWAAVAWDANGYSTAVTIRPGVTFTNMLIGDERWGDYTGSQTKYNQPGFVWANGSYTAPGNTTRTWIAELNTTTATGIQTPVAEPEGSVYPNPAVEETTVKFTLTSAGRITVQLFDAGGKLVGTPFNGSVAAGDNAITFRTGHLPSGIYNVSITTSNGVEVGRYKFVK